MKKAPALGGEALGSAGEGGLLLGPAVGAGDAAGLACDSASSCVGQCERAALVAFLRAWVLGGCVQGKSGRGISGCEADGVTFGGIVRPCEIGR